MYATVAFSLTGGNILKWFRDEFGKIELDQAKKSNCDPYELLLKQLPEEPSRLLVLPYFTPSGTPYFDVEVRGAIIGLDLSTTRAEMMRALLEGVAFEVRLNLDILEQSGNKVNELRIIGGGAKSITHVQLKADVIGKPITILDVTEAGCLGVAMLAKAAHTGQHVSQISKEWIKPVAQVKPKNSEFYSKKFQSYKKLYPLIKSFTH